MFCRHCGNHVRKDEWVARASMCHDCFVNDPRKWDE